MLRSFLDRPSRVGVVGQIQTGNMKKTKSRGGREFWMGNALDHWLVTLNTKAADGHNFMVDDDVMREQGQQRRLGVRAAFDTADAVTRIDRSLFVGASRACHSIDGIVATWYLNPTDDGPATPLPESMEPQVVSRNGVSLRLVCHEDTCPVVKSPLRRGRSTFVCRPRGSFLFRVWAAKHNGIYVYKTTSLPSTEAVWAMLRHVEELTAGNLSAAPLELVMTQATPRHGSTINRSCLQLACSPQEAVDYACRWQDHKARLRRDGDELPGELPGAPEVSVGDAIDAQPDLHSGVPVEVEPHDESGHPESRQEEPAGRDAAPSAKAHHQDLARTMTLRKRDETWSLSDIEELMAHFNIERVTEANPEEAQLMLVALSEPADEFWTRFHTTGQFGRNPTDTQEAPPGAPQTEDDIPF